MPLYVVYKKRIELTSTEVEAENPEAAIAASNNDWTEIMVDDSDEEVLSVTDENGNECGFDKSLLDELRG